MKYITDIMHEYSQMTDEELATHLSQQAHANKKIKYAFIRDFQERNLAKRYLKALDEIINNAIKYNISLDESFIFFISSFFLI